MIRTHRITLYQQTLKLIPFEIHHVSCVANSKIKQITRFHLLCTTSQVTRCTLNSVQMDRFWLHHTPTRFILVCPVPLETLKSSRAQLFVSFSSDTLRHANVTWTAQYMDCLLPPYTKLASLRDVGVNAGFCGPFSNRLNFRILVKGRTSARDEIFAPRQTLDSLSPYSVCNW